MALDLTGPDPLILRQIYATEQDCTDHGVREHRASRLAINDVLATAIRLRRDFRSTTLRPLDDPHLATKNDRTVIKN